MDARRYDRNADQLSQIFWHFTKIQRLWAHAPHPKVNQMIDTLQEALALNDELGQMAEKGLI